MSDMKDVIDMMNSSNPAIRAAGRNMYRGLDKNEAGRSMTKKQKELLSAVAEYLDVRAGDPWPDELWPAANDVLHRMAEEIREHIEIGDITVFL